MGTGDYVQVEPFEASETCWLMMRTQVSERDLFSMFRHHKRLFRSVLSASSSSSLTSFLSPRIVVHFFRESTERCKLLDRKLLSTFFFLMHKDVHNRCFYRHLSQLAVEHVETMFVKVDVEKVTSPCSLCIIFIACTFPRLLSL